MTVRITAEIDRALERRIVSKAQLSALKIEHPRLEALREQLASQMAAMEVAEPSEAARLLPTITASRTALQEAARHKVSDQDLAAASQKLRTAAQEVDRLATERFESAAGKQHRETARNALTALLDAIDAWADARIVAAQEVAATVDVPALDELRPLANQLAPLLGMSARPRCPIEEKRHRAGEGVTAERKRQSVEAARKLEREDPIEAERGLRVLEGSLNHELGEARELLDRILNARRRNTMLHISTTPDGEADYRRARARVEQLKLLITKCQRDREELRPKIEQHRRRVSEANRQLEKTARETKPTVSA